MKSSGEKKMSSRGKRGEIWTVELNGKRRPAVIVSNDHVIAELDHLIATVTSQSFCTYPTMYDLILLNFKSI
ncbi:type II toxin-antitoxin system PemK/MazF family toxin [Metabacillus litoralis]|nr:type II toxin-antitoxin system PemK/MazF family toxin [Metabacillus litoralis]